MAPHGTEPIERPAHYCADRSIEPIDVIEDWDLPHHLACVVKYLARAGRKGAAIDDLKKARWYLDRAVRRLSDADPWREPWPDDTRTC